jgi:hypothetical protein
VTASFRRLVDLGLAAYRDAGCRSGRYVLARSIRDLSPVHPPQARLALARLRELTTTVEPGSGLIVFVRTVGTARIFHDGVLRTVGQGQSIFDAEKHDPVEIAALPGDTVSIAVDEPYSTDDVEGRSFVVALNVRFEGRDLAPQHLFVDLGPSGDGMVTSLQPLPIAKKLSNPPKSLFGRSREQDEALRAFNCYFELPRTTRRSVDVPCLGDMVGFAKEFELRKLGLIWAGTETDRFAIVIRVPDA